MLIDRKFDKKMFFIGVVLFLGILPATKLMGYTLPWQYFLIPILTNVLLLLLFKWVAIPNFAKILLGLWIVIILEVIFSGIFSPMLTIGEFKFPIESLQYISRFLFFITFIMIFYNYKIDYKKFMYLFAGILSLGMFVGIIQTLDLGIISNLFRELYTFSDVHLEYMKRDNKRISGVAHHATANGGIAVFTMIIIISLHIFYKKRLFITSIGIFLTSFNVIMSQSRMGYLTIIFSLIIFYVVYNRIYIKNIKSKLKSTLILTSIFALVTGIIYFLYHKGNMIIMKVITRIELLEKQIVEGGNRLGQVEYALAQINTPFEFLFGISRGVQNTITDFYIELEPVNIFVLYGLIGFILQYSLILVLLIYFYKNMIILKKYPIMLTMVVTSFITLLSYQFFSIAYFFFRETYVGLFPWILMGATIGALEKLKKSKRQL